MVSRGVVREFHAGQGWGVIDGDDVPGGCWVHFSAIAGAGYRELAAGTELWFEPERAEQDGFAYRAVVAWSGPAESDTGHVGGEPSSAYRGSLTISVDPPPGNPQ